MCCQPRSGSGERVDRFWVPCLAGSYYVDAKVGTKSAVTSIASNRGLEGQRRQGNESLMTLGQGRGFQVSAGELISYLTLYLPLPFSCTIRVAFPLSTPFGWICLRLHDDFRWHEHCSFLLFSARCRQIKYAKTLRIPWTAGVGGRAQNNQDDRLEEPANGASELDIITKNSRGSSSRPEDNEFPSIVVLLAAAE